MSKVKIQGNASGTGVLTVTAPNTSTDRTITLPDSTDTLAVNSDVTNKLPLAGGTLTGNLIAGGEIKVGTSDNGKITSTFALTLDPPTGEPIVFRTAGTDIARFNPGGGLCFGTDTAAANALDDYEEGTCTIQYSDGSTTVGDSNLSKYTKVGRLVTVTGYLNTTNIDSLSNGLAIRLTGFPFTNTTDTTFPYFTRFWDMPTGTINTVGYLPLGQTYCTFYAMKDNASYQQIICGDVGNSNDLYFGVSYHAS